MVCICSCGKEYGFEPLEYWFCPSCWRLNYTGAPIDAASTPVVEPDSADEMYRSDTDFEREANAGAHSNPGSWKSWYAVGIAYARRLNLFQTGIFWTCALCLIEDDRVAESFVSKTQRMFVEIMIGNRIRGRKFNAPHLTSMEYHCMMRFPERKTGYCHELADMLYDASSGLRTDFRFSMVNLCSRIRISGLPVHPDLIYCRECLGRIVEDVDRFCFESGEKRSRLRRAVPKRHFELSLWLTMPYRVALTDTERVISDTSESEVRRLGSIQPADGSAGFVNHLLNAIRKGGELALIRVERKRDEERVMELEDGVMDEIRLYLDEYIAGSQDTVPENRVMLAPPEPPELHWLRR